MIIKWKVQFKGLPGWFDLKENRGESHHQFGHDGHMYRTILFNSATEARERAEIISADVPEHDEYRIVPETTPEEWNAYP